MTSLVNPAFVARLSLFVYRYRFLVVYVAFGFLSLVLEVVVSRGLAYFGIPFALAQTLGLISGIFFAFWMNVRFNFKVPVRKRNRSLAIFAGISIVSASLNFFLRDRLLGLHWSYEEGRFLISCGLFAFAYLLHRRFSFADRKQVGVAVYANGIENIRDIWNRISDFPDFIHVDLIDSSYGDGSSDVRSYRLEAIRAYWPKKKIQVHIMSKTPSRWLEDVLPFVDTIFIHREIDEDVAALLRHIRAAGKEPGLAVQNCTPVEAIAEFIPLVSVVMLLSIEVPGKSGQPFLLSTLERIEEINKMAERGNFSLCIDGGVGTANVHLLNVELVVSGSSVLSAGNPRRQIMRLQTSNNHEAT